MDSNSHPADSDDHPHPKLVSVVGILIAVITLVFPLSTVFRYAPEAPSSLSGSTSRTTASTSIPPLGFKD